MAVTSLLLPPAATGWWVVGRARVRTPARRPEAVLFDRDGTLIEDVPYNGDPSKVQPRPGAVEAVRRLRARGIAVGLVTNQSGVAAGRITEAEVRRVNVRVTEILGPFDAMVVCPHASDAGCGCRKPAPGMVIEAARRLGAAPARCVVVGDIGSDVGAGLAAGARAILVPTAVTRAEEVADAPVVASDLGHAVRLILGEEAPA